MFQLQYQNAKSTAFRISRLSNSWVLHRGPHRSWIGWKTWHQVQISKIHTSKLKTSNESDDSSPCWTAYRQDFEDPWQLTLENMHHLRLRKRGNPIATLPVRTKSPIPVHEEVAVVVNKKPGFQHHSTSTFFGAFRGPQFPHAGINLFSIPKEIKSGHVDLSLWCTWWSAAVPNPSFLTCTHLCIRLKNLESISETKRHVVYIYNLESPNFAWKLRPKDGQTRSGSTQASVSKSRFWMWIMSWISTDNGDVSTRWGWVWLPVCVEGSEGHVRPQDASDVMKSLSFYESPHHVEERCAHQNDAQKSLPVFNVFCCFEW